MRHEPDRVRGVPREAATEVVVDPAVGHRIERPPGHRQRPLVAGPDVLSQQEPDRHRLRELRRAAPSAVAGIERGLERRRGRVEQAGRVGRRAPIERLPERRRARLAFPHVVGEPRRRGFDLGPVVAPDLADPREQLPERRHAVTRLIGEVRAAVEGPAVGREEDAHRPAAAPGHRLDGIHVDRVEVGPLLAIDLDRDEAGVQIGGRRLILERLALHDVAPVARGVADREEDRAIHLARPLRCLGPPRVPVDRVVGVLEQVRARLARQPVRVSGRGGRLGVVGHRGHGTRQAPRERRGRPSSGYPLAARYAVMTRRVAAIAERDVLISRVLGNDGNRLGQSPTHEPAR